MNYENKKKRDTQELLQFIINQELDLEQYPSLRPKINEQFMISKRGGGIQSFTDELIEKIIGWEKGNKDSSLEKLLADNFLIYKRI